MKQLTIKTILQLLKKFTDKKCAKKEIKYVYYNAKKKELVASDVKKIIVIEKDLGEENLFIDVNNVNENGDAIKVVGNFAVFKEEDIGKYPNYEKIIPTGFETKVELNLDISSVIMNVGVLTDKKIIVNYEKEYNDLSKLLLNDIKIVFNDKEDPFMIQGKISNFFNSEFKIVIAPFKQ